MKNKKNFTYFIGGILVVSLLVLIVQTQYLKTTQSTATETNLGTFTNPEVAYQECKSILSDVSKALNTSDTTN
ncbi:hypothetical protein ACPDHL_05675 [Myroides sp. C15-4]|uniref:hypothetical protein n=1 Tax=Myroides sp. C15-4 TaxID=3400532 RepID=UPI003D2F8129